MQTSYNIFIGANSSVHTFDSTTTLAEVRIALTDLGLMSSTDSFLYENSMTQLKTVFGPVSDEVNAYISGATFPAVPSELSNSYELIQIVSTASDAPAFLGTTPPDGYFRPNGQMAVNISLNNSDQVAISNNAGMFEPVLLQNVQSANADDPVSFTNCVIVQKGAIISFNIASWGAAGWGYTITAAESLGGTNICDGLFIPYSSNYGNSVSTTLNRYASGNVGDTIQIQSNASLNIAQQYNVEYSTITVNTYSLTSWSDAAGTVYSSSLPIPSGAAKDFSMMLDKETGPEGWVPPPPAGGSDVPSNTTGSGSPKAGPPSTQTFGSPINSLIPASCPATRSTGLVGSVEIYFLVFDNVTDANTVIKVLNAGTMQV
jgi:hypothetical protein